MLYDRGLQTLEQIKEYEDYLYKRITEQSRGCISSRICESCKHLISDSVCLCIGIFTCPNCGFENGQVERKLRENNNNQIVFNNWPTLEGRLNNPITTELEALQQLERSVPLSEEGKERLKKLMEKLKI